MSFAATAITFKNILLLHLIAYEKCVWQKWVVILGQMLITIPITLNLLDCIIHIWILPDVKNHLWDK